jgi:hypothetical protein
MAAYADAAAWNQWIDQARSTPILGVVQSFPGVKLRKAGTVEWEGPCPFCRAGDDRFSVNVKKQVFNCRKCGGGGDVIHFVEWLTGCAFLEACERINGTPRPDRSRDETLEDKRARLDRQAERRAELERQQEEQRLLEAAKAKRDEEAIDKILDKNRAVNVLESDYGTAYLRGRGLTPQRRLVGDIRFVPDLDYWGARDNGTREIVHLATLPAIIAVIRAFDGAIIGISQTYLDPKEPRKWRPEGSPTNSAKKIRGEKKGGMIHLWGRPSETLAIGEGWENCLAWHQLGYGPEDVTLAAAVDLGNLAGGASGPWPHPVLKDADGRPIRIVHRNHDPKNPGIILPDGIKSIILLADLDSETYATAAKLLVAGNRFVAMGYQVDVAWPRRGQDWNDTLIAHENEDQLGRAAGTGTSI